jgi:hypothetical protein
MRGLDAADFREVGELICEVLRRDADLPALSQRVDALLARRPLYAGLRAYPTFDD